MHSDANPGLAPIKKLSVDQLAKVAASDFTKLVDNSFSPNKRFAMGVGSLDGSKPVWKKSTVDEKESFDMIKNYESGNCGNYLIDLKADRVTMLLDSDHFGTRNRYNNETCASSWSPDSHWFVDTQSWRRHSSVCTVYLLNKEGRAIERMDFLQAAERIVSKQLRIQYPKMPMEEKAGYRVTLSDVSISDNGILIARISAQQTDRHRDGSLDLVVTAKVGLAKTGGLSYTVAKVEKAKEDGN